LLEFFNAFGVDALKLAFQVVNFLLVLWLLNKFLFSRVLERLDERRTKIEKGLEDAEAAARDRELARAEREAAVAEARREAQAMVARATKMADDTRDEILAAARADAEKATARAREEINAEKEKALAELRTHVAELALDAAGKLVRSEMTAATHRRLVEEFLTEVEPKGRTAGTSGGGKS
jgi:F-type H+-transporting ATPase subunit b